MNRQWVKILLILWTLTLAIVWLRRALVPHPYDELPLSVRIMGLTTNISPSGFEWEAGVPKSKNHRAAVLFCSLQFEETNKSSAQASKIVLSPTEQDLMSVPCAPNEEGILTWRFGESLKAEKVYRVIGSCYKPNRVEDRIRSLCERVPGMGRLLPQPRLRFATSEWFEVTTMMNPSGERQ